MAVFTSLSVFLFSAIALVVPSGYSLGVVLLVLGSLALLGKHPGLDLKKEDYLFIAVLLAYAFFTIAINLLQGAGLSEYDLPLRFIIAVPVALLLKRYPPSPASFWGGLAIGAIFAASFSGWQNLFLGNTRAGGFTNPIQFGNISLVFGILCLAGLKWAFSQQKKFWPYLLAAGAGSGLLGSVFTGSRGSWISLPFCLIVFYRYYGRGLSKRLIVGSITVVIFIFMAIYAIPHTGVKDRMQLAMTEAKDYIENGNAESSTGTRLEMWRAGSILIEEKPWLGWGQAPYKERIRQLSSEGRISSIVEDHSHLHNEYLDAFAKRGIGGLALVLGLFLFPLMLFKGKISGGNRAVLPYAVAGIILPVAYMGFGLTQAFLSHNSGVIIFVFMLVFLWALLRNHES